MPGSSPTSERLYKDAELRERKLTQMKEQMECERQAKKKVPSQSAVDPLVERKFCKEYSQCLAALGLGLAEDTTLTAEQVSTAFI